MTTIHFIRHGEVENPGHTYYGRLPGYPLSELGKMQIESTAKRLKSYPIAAIFHSPLERAKQTATIINQFFQLPLQSDERLNEVGTRFEGKPREQMTQNPPAAEDFAETMDQIYQRMADFVHEIGERYPDKVVVAVSHGGPIHILELGLQSHPFTHSAYEQDTIPACGSDTMVIVAGKKITVKRAS